MTKRGSAAVLEMVNHQSQRTEVVNVTPQMAQQWLEKNSHNRNISEGLVLTYAEDMRRGAWYLHHQGIAFDWNGLLADGQHRLWAIVRSKMTIPMLVTWNVDPQSLGNIDGMRVRNVADQMGLIDGVSASRRVASNCVMIGNIETDWEHSQRKSTLSQVREIFQRHKTGVHWAISAFGSGRLWGAAPVSGTMGFCYPRDPVKANVFAKQLTEGENISKRDPAYSVRRYVTDLHGASSMTERRMLSIVVMRSFYAFCHGHDLEVIKPALLEIDSAVYQKSLAYFRRGHTTST